VSWCMSGPGADGLGGFRVHDIAAKATSSDRSPSTPEESDASAQEAMRAFLESLPDAVVIVGGNGRVVLVNASTEAMFGYPRDQLVGRPVEMLVPERLRERHRLLRERYIAEPRIRPMSARLDFFGRRSDGTEFPVDISLSAHETGCGLVFTAVVRDETDRRQPDKFSLLFESAPDAVVVIETDGRIALVNAQTERLFGFERESLVGEHVEILLPHRYRHSHIGHRGRYAVSPQIRAMGSGHHLHGMRADGSEFPVDVSLAPVETAQGRLVAATVRDVTDRKKLEGVRDQFIHHAAHELRTPLATLAALGETLALRMGEMSPEDVADALGALMRQGQRASTLVGNLLDLSQLEGGHADVRMGPVDLGRTAGRVLEGALNPERKTVTCELDHFVVFADQLQLERLLTNLLTNAYRYGGTDICITAESTDGHVVTAVSDNGDGVPEELIETVFEPFVRGRMAGTVGGSGIGLALCRRIVDSMGGTIWYDGAVSGASFKFRLREHR
jgi:PAS domain S-box-containing protein